MVDHNRQETDYINASHIRFRASKKHFIASQGPLAAATDDFWQLVWQERVGVIVMLCNLKEGGMEKCHSYFDEGVYGPLRLRRIASTSPERPEATQAEQDQHAAQGFFSAADMNRSQSVNRTEDTTTAYTARREFNLDRPSDRSHQTPSETRQLRHFQFGNWPDFDIPPDPHTLIRFINEVDAANTEVAQLNGFETPGPVLVHCSAGVGRTGCFMVIDTLLDQLGLQDQGSSRMSVDEPLHPQPVYPEHSGFDSAQTPPLLRDDPVFSTVNEMREQRMSMVANLAQYQFIHMALMAGLASAVVTPKASEGPSASAA